MASAADTCLSIRKKTPFLSLLLWGEEKKIENPGEARLLQRRKIRRRGIKAAGRVNWQDRKIPMKSGTRRDERRANTKWNCPRCLFRLIIVSRSLCYSHLPANTTFPNVSSLPLEIKLKTEMYPMYRLYGRLFDTKIYTFPVRSRFSKFDIRIHEYNILLSVST